jgi:hypothetical protein
VKFEGIVADRCRTVTGEASSAPKSDASSFVPATSDAETGSVAATALSAAPTAGASQWPGIWPFTKPSSSAASAMNDHE